MSGLYKNDFWTFLFTLETDIVEICAAARIDNINRNFQKFFYYSISFFNKILSDT